MGIKDLSLGRGGDIFRIPVKDLRVSPSDLTRIEFGDLDQLARSLAVNGQREPMTVRVARSVGGVELDYITNGVRRYKAILIANTKYGAKITEVKAVNEPAEVKTDSDRVLLQIRSNEGKPFTALEYGMGFRRLLEAGYTVSKIAEASAHSRTWVTDCLALASDQEAVKNAVKEGKIKPATAKKLRSADPQDRETALLKADLGQKVTGKEVDDAKKEREASRKPSESLVNPLEFDAGAFVEGLRKRGFRGAAERPEYKGNVEIRVNVKEPPFVAVLVL